MNVPLDDRQTTNKSTMCFRDEGLGVVVNHAFPHAVLFPRCQLVLCHGGVGTLHSALAAGTPVGGMACQAPSDQGFWADVVHSKVRLACIRRRYTFDVHVFAHVCLRTCGCA